MFKIFSWGVAAIVTGVIFLLMMRPSADSPSDRTDTDLSSVANGGASDVIGPQYEALNQRVARLEVQTGELIERLREVEARNRTGPEQSASPSQFQDGTPADRARVAIPIPLSPEMEMFLANSDAAARLHSQIETETLDPVWGPTTEARFSDYLSQRQELMRYGIPTVHCRSETCEVQLVTYVEHDLDWEGWLALLGIGVDEQPWGTEFWPTGLTYGEHNGASTVILHMNNRACAEGRVIC